MRARIPGVVRCSGRAAFRSPQKGFAILFLACLAGAARPADGAEVKGAGSAGDPPRVSRAALGAEWDGEVSGGNAEVEVVWPASGNPAGSRQSSVAALHASALWSPDGVAPSVSAHIGSRAWAAAGRGGQGSGAAIRRLSGASGAGGRSLIGFSGADAADPWVLGAGIAGLSLFAILPDGGRRAGAEWAIGDARLGGAAGIMRGLIPERAGTSGWRPARLPAPGDSQWWGALTAAASAADRPDNPGTPGNPGRSGNPSRSGSPGQDGKSSQDGKSGGIRARLWSAVSIPDLLAPGIGAHGDLAMDSGSLRIGGGLAAIGFAVSTRVADRAYRDPNGDQPADLARHTMELDIRMGNMRGEMKIRGSRRRPSGFPSAASRGRAAWISAFGVPVEPGHYLPDRWRIVASVFRTGIVAPTAGWNDATDADPDPGADPDAAFDAQDPLEMELEAYPFESGLSGFFSLVPGQLPEMDLVATLSGSASAGTAGRIAMSGQVSWSDVPFRTGAIAQSAAAATGTGGASAPVGASAAATELRPSIFVSFRFGTAAGNGGLALRVGARPAGAPDPSVWPGAHAISLRADADIRVAGYRVELSLRSPEGGWLTDGTKPAGAPRVVVELSYAPRRVAKER